MSALEPVDLSYTTYAAVLVLALLSGVTTMAGVALAIWLGNSPRAIAVGIGFSSGIMILISIFELLPESVGHAGYATTGLATALGAALIIALQVLIPHTHLVEARGTFPSRQLKTTYLVAFGLILHDFPEGFAMANAYLSSPSLGILVALAIAIHNVPEEFAMAVPAVAMQERGFLYKVAFVSGLAEPAGAVLGLIAVNLHPALNPAFMAFAAGAMVVVSLIELAPMARRYGRMGLFALGFASAALVYLALHTMIPH